MAWQSPKTNWQPADGVRDTDFNRIEGNILELYNGSKVNNDITLYVRETGSDLIGDGSTAAPYRTITKALSTIPKNLSGKTVLVYVQTGSYDEDVVVNGYSNGRIVITGYSGHLATIRSLVINSSICDIRTVDIHTTTGGVTVNNGSTLICTGDITCVGGGTKGLHVLGCSSCHISGRLTVDNAAAIIQASSASSAFVRQISGTGSANAIIAEEGSTVSYTLNNSTVTAAAFVTRTGGRINTGSGGTA